MRKQVQLFYPFSCLKYQKMLYFCMSDEQEKRLKRKVQLIVISAMSLFFILVTVVVYQFAIRINQTSTARSLESQNASLEEQIKFAEEDIKYFSSEQFKYDYALRYLNRGRPGDKISTGR